MTTTTVRARARRPRPGLPRPGDGVEAKVLAIVAEQTGYPEDLLDMDLDLEADLGIDTVKQAEVFATIREAYGIERDDSLKLRDYPTLTAVVGFVRERTPQAAPPAGRPSPEPGRLAAPERPRRAMGWRRRCWRSWPPRRATRRTCWTWTWTWRRTWGSTRSSRRRCSRRSVRRMGSSATTR